MDYKCEPSTSKVDNKNISVCRLCSSKNAKNPIFPDNANEFKNYKEKGPPLVCKIMSCVNIQVRKDDGLPSLICDDCVNKVESTYEFLQLCEMSDSFLRQYLDFGLRISWFFRHSELRHSEIFRSDYYGEPMLQMSVEESDDER